MDKASESSRYCLPEAVSMFSLSIIATLYLQSTSKTLRYKQEIAKQAKFLRDERTGRINAEKKIRKEHQDALSSKGIHVESIGVIESPFPYRCATPRQPILAPAGRAFIRFNKKLIQYEHYEELAQFSHIWVIFLFHENTSIARNSATVPGKVAPPRLLGKRVGCLSTRSPHRPNPIGLSVCEIVSVSEQGIELRGVDFVSGTPVLDIKPYIPYDIIPSTYTLPMATDSSGKPLPVQSLRVPSWVVESDIPLHTVSFTNATEQSLRQIIARKQVKFYNSFEQMVEFIRQILRQDVRGVHQGRGRSTANGGTGIAEEVEEGSGSGNANGLFLCRLDNVEIGFSSSDNGILIESILFEQMMKSVTP